MGIATDIGNSILGNVETAYLVVDDYRALCKPPENSASAQKQGAVKKAAAIALEKGAAATKTPPPQSEKKYFKVQFNPSELQLNANVTPEIKPSIMVDKKGVKREVTASYKKPSITLITALIFDDTNISDAFMTTTGPGGVASTVANVATSIATLAGAKWSVQPKVSALFGALRNNYTRFVTFYWSDFSFAGQLVSVGTEYTMFSTEGRPIRATVNLRIRQELDPNHLNKWYEEFAESFGASGSLTGASQRVANMFQLNL